MERASVERSEKVVIVGAGIAGLCAGVYARQNGLDAEIVEMGHSSGGLATSWQRGDYTFENCLDWLLGSRPGSAWHARWKEVFDIDALAFVERVEYGRLETDAGESVAFPVDPDLLEQELLRVAPEDEAEIRRLALGVRRLARFEMPVADVSAWRTLAGWVRALPLLPELRHWSRLSMQQFAARFRNPLLRAYFSVGMEGRLSALALVLSMAWMARGDASYPIGGSQAVVKRIEARFRELGGAIRFGARVDRILVDGDRAVGVHLADGDTIRADWVISAADGHSTLFDWLPQRFRDRRTERLYESTPTFPSYLQVSLGVRRDLLDLPRAFVHLVDEPRAIDPATRARTLAFRVFHYDPTFAPPGKTAITCFIPTYDYAHWVTLEATQPADYAARKRDIADFVVGVLEQRVPGVRGDLEVIDVSTPATVVRYTGNWKGSMEGFLPTPATGMRSPRIALPGLERFLMAGQWVMPGGGLPTGLMTARRCVQEICKATKRRFASRPLPSRAPATGRPVPA